MTSQHNGFTEMRDLNNNKIIPMKTRVILTDFYVVKTLHLVRENGKTKCNQFASGCCLVYDGRYEQVYKETKNCKRCFD